LLDPPQAESIRILLLDAGCMHLVLSSPVASASDIGNRSAAGLIHLSEVDVFSRQHFDSGKAQRAGRECHRGLMGKLAKDGRRGSSLVILDNRGATR
jgi:hypothetical protein